MDPKDSILIKERILKSVSKAWTLFLDLIFPIECLGCGREGVWLCESCRKTLRMNRRQYCLDCRKGSRSGRFCRHCRLGHHLDGLWIAGDYEQKLLAELIKRFKYDFIRDLGEPLGGFLLRFLRGRLFDSLKEGGGTEILRTFQETLIIPVPLHRRRFNWRGFNQAEVLARTVGGYFRLEMEVASLERTRYRRPQAKLGGRRRRENVRNCFAWRGEDLGGRNVILVDDVVTTGATLDEAARVLKENGAGEVWGLVAAKG